MSRKAGKTSASSTVPFGISAPTRSRAAERMTTYRTLLIKPRDYQAHATRDVRSTSISTEKHEGSEDANVIGGERSDLDAKFFQKACVA